MNVTEDQQNWERDGAGLLNNVPGKVHGPKVYGLTDIARTDRGRAV